MGPVRRIARSLPATLLAITLVSGLAIWAGIRFRLTVGGSIALYFVVWWTILFAILPIRVRTQADAGVVVEGSDPGAPADPALRERAIWTTMAAAIAFVGVIALLPLAGL